MSERKTLAVVVNGKPLAGKDTFVDFCMEALEAGGVSAAKVSSVDRVKQAAHILGWDGVKDDKGRRFLSDLKDLSGAVYGGPMAYMLEMLGGAEVVFYHIREPEEIAAFVERSGGISVLIDRPSSDPLFSNHADQRTHLADYTYTIFNHLDLSYLRSTALAFCSKLVRDYLGKTCTLTKTAADYTPLSPSEVKEIAESVAPNPSVGETWIIKKSGASALMRVVIDDISAHSVCFTPVGPGYLGKELQRLQDIEFVERLHPANTPPDSPPSDEWETKDLCRRCGNRRCPMAGRTGATTNCVNYVGMVDLDEPEEEAPAPFSLSLPSITVEGDLEEVYEKLVEELGEWSAADGDTMAELVEAWDVIQVAQTYKERGGEALTAFSLPPMVEYYRADPERTESAKRAMIIKNAARAMYAPEVCTKIIMSGGHSW